MQAFWVLMLVHKGNCKNIHLGYVKISNKHSVKVFSADCSLLCGNPHFIYIALNSSQPESDSNSLLLK